jgi:protein-S-isoprenylcysteine O-methyltransferase Ste14
MPIPVAARNFPIPEPHLGVLGASVALQFLRPLDVPSSRATAFVGGALVGGGVAIALAATVAAERVNLAEPDALVTAGPFAVSRNPMYEAWTAIYLGAGLTMRSIWPFVLLPGLLALVHVAIGKEEDLLRERFGATYDDYVRRVPRYAAGHAMAWAGLKTVSPHGSRLRSAVGAPRGGR